MRLRSLLVLVLGALLAACGDEAPAPAEQTERVDEAPSEAPEAPAAGPTVPDDRLELPTWPADRPNERACEEAADCVYTNANRQACCVSERGAIYAQDFVSWRSSWIRGNCPANDCVEVLREPAEPCGREARCVEGQCRDACDR